MARIETISYPLNTDHTDGGELRFTQADPAGDIAGYNGIIFVQNRGSEARQVTIGEAIGRPTIEIPAAGERLIAVNTGTKLQYPLGAGGLYLALVVPKGVIA
jgi:hypothetical protein